MVLTSTCFPQTGQLPIDLKVSCQMWSKPLAAQHDNIRGWSCLCCLSLSCCFRSFSSAYKYKINSTSDLKHNNQRILQLFENSWHLCMHFLCKVLAPCVVVFTNGSACMETNSSNYFIEKTVKRQFSVPLLVTKGIRTEFGHLFMMGNQVQMAETSPHMGQTQKTLRTH